MMDSLVTVRTAMLFICQIVPRRLHNHQPSFWNVLGASLIESTRENLFSGNVSENPCRVGCDR